MFNGLTTNNTPSGGAQTAAEREEKMKKGAIKINGAYGARIGGKTVFTYEGAAELYELFVETCIEV